MKKIADFFKANRYAIIWTLCYILVMKFILSTLFNFDMFSTSAWQVLVHSHLYGFGGFVFGLLVLAAVPMYVATTTVIVRTKKPLFTIPVPKFIQRAFAPPPPPAPEPTPAPEAPQPKTTQILEYGEFPADMPLEMRGAFIRARRGAPRPQVSAFDTSHITNTSATASASEADNTFADAADFPLPLNFDSTEDNATATESPFPSFTTINFDAPTEEPAAPILAPDETARPKNDEILQRLAAAGRTARPDGEFIICDEYLIATHTDTDFWIADDIDWFAGGQQRPSPVAAVIARATELKMKPVLYLGATNILDLENRIAEWEKDGIRIINSLDDLK